VTTNDFNVAEKMRALSGRDDQYRDPNQINSRIDELQAAVLRVKMRFLDEWNQERHEIARLYSERLPKEVRPVAPPDRGFHHLLAVRCEKRDELQLFLRERGIETKVHFPRPLHRYDAPWSGLSRSLPGAERWCATVLSLPCYPGLAPEQVDVVCEQVRRWQRS
jgi:dTDP-4-amino-4,6-dideoxygalactose transaminase